MRRLLVLLVLLALAVLSWRAVGALLERVWAVLVERSASEERGLRDRPYRAPSPERWDTLVDLAGTWSLRVGDDRAWSADSLRVDAWSAVAVPGAWENGGFHGLDGTVWLRTAFELSGAARDAAGAHLLLGRVDDADEVWLNGVFIGSTGRMPPHYETASFIFRRYPVPPGVLRAGTNTLAVRVHDAALEGGIVEGPVALAVPTARNPASVPLVADLAGDWALRLGERASDDPARLAAPGADDAGWERVRVPARWEPQGIDYDGVAWMRRPFTLSAADAAQDLTLVLGAVDDLDETYVNGVLVGQTGDLLTRRVQGDEWQRERAYAVPASVLRAGDNVVAVRVYDGLLDGGITRGPVGLMTPGDYARRDALVTGGAPASP